MINEVNCATNPVEFVEIKNVGDGAIATAGYGVTGNVDDDAFPVPPRTLEPGERVMVTGDLGLSCSREGAVLVKDGLVVDEAPIRVGDADRSTWGRVPDGTGAFQESTPTPQKENRAFVDGRGDVFDFNEAPAIVELFVDADVERTLREQGKEAGYVPASFSFTDENGTSPPQRVDVRIKGSITLRPWEGKPALKIHFARPSERGERGPAEFRGLRKLTLNNLTYDPSFVREHLAYALMREAGHPGPRVSWIHVFINGEDKGLYTTIETYDRVFLADHYEGTEVMYESDGLTNVGDFGGFDVDEGPEDFAPFEDLAARVQAANPADVVRAVPDVDWRQIARLSALEDILAHFDGHKGACHNFFVHKDTNGMFTVLPWSVDLTLVNFNGESGAGSPLGSCGKLAAVCDTDPQCHAWFLRDRDRAAQLVLHPNGAGWRERLTPIAAALQSFAHADQEPFSNNEFFNGESTDLVNNTNNVVDQLEARARAIRCASAVERGLPPTDGLDANCDGFSLSSGPGR